MKVMSIKRQNDDIIMAIENEYNAGPRDMGHVFSIRLANVQAWTCNFLTGIIHCSDVMIETPSDYSSFFGIGWILPLPWSATF